jgi:hypothetical protein
MEEENGRQRSQTMRAATNQRRTQMTKKTETVASQMKRLDDAIKLKEVEIITDGLEAIVKSESKKAPKGE